MAKKKKKSNNRQGNWQECRKCGKWHNCDEHHLLPKAIFGDGETAPVCKNCHDEFHRYMGHEYLRKENKQPEEFYFYTWLKWLHLVALGAVLIAIGLLLTR